MLASSVSASEVAQAVRSFDRRFGEMERVAFRLSQTCRRELLSRQGTQCLEELVWLVKRWMGVQGVSAEVKSIAAHALLSLSWTPELFVEEVSYTAADETFACERVSALVGGIVELGWHRKEFSLASKVLHWLLPSRIPVYDQFVRDILRITTAWPDRAYREIVQWEFAAARQLTVETSEWIGSAEPKSPLRALDKYLWWKGGGESGNAVVVRDPWKAVRHLGIGPN
jgi:hypothetical protein